MHIFTCMCLHVCRTKTSFTKQHPLSLHVTYCFCTVLFFSFFSSSSFLFFCLCVSFHCCQSDPSKGCHCCLESTAQEELMRPQSKLNLFENSGETSSDLQKSSRSQVGNNPQTRCLPSSSSSISQARTSGQVVCGFLKESPHLAKRCSVRAQGLAGATEIYDKSNLTSQLVCHLC